MSAGSGRPLTFDGKRSGAIEAGSTLLSDPVDLAVPPLVDVAVDLYLPGDTWATTSPATYHMAGLTTNYLSPSGDHTGVTALPVEATLPSWFFLSRVDVNTDTAPGAIVLFGDSITDGTASTPDTNSRWPDVLAKRLVEAWGDAAPGVLNVGIAGNRILSDNLGMAGFPARWQRRRRSSSGPERVLWPTCPVATGPRCPAAAGCHPCRRA